MSAASFHDSSTFEPQHTQLAALRAGDAEAFEALVRENGGRMLATARRLLRSEEDARDAVQDEKLGPVYAVRIALDRAALDVAGRQAPLGAGMTATAEIKTDRRRMIEYLLSPVLRYKQESLRER